MSDVPNRWTCQLHAFDGNTDDESYQEHIDTEHGGATIAVMWWRACPDCGRPEGTFACKIRHIQVNTGWAKSAND